MRSKKEDFKNLGLASLGAVLEYFDFVVYVFVAVAISDAFFPAGASTWVKQVQTFGIYAVGYLVRPMAGVVIAHFADQIGRKKLFIFTVLLMSVPTFLMGLLPTYQQVGLWAPMALLLLRILQGCAVGGELPGASVFISEHAPPARLGFSSGTFYGIVNCGLLLGAGAAAFSKYIASLDPSLASLAWRLPFILGGIFGLTAAYLRRHLSETPLFEEIHHDRKISKRVPITDVIKNYRGQCVFAAALVFVFSTTTGVYFQYLPSFLIGELHFSDTVVFHANIVGVIGFVIGMPLWGLLRDRIGWSGTLVLGAIAGAATALWFFNGLASFGRSDSDLLYAFIAVGLASGCVHALLPGLISSLFPTAIRQSGFAFPYTIGTAIFTGLTPLVLAWLVRDFGLSAPMYLYLLACAVALVLAWAVRRMTHYLGEPVTASVSGTIMPVNHR